MKKIVMLLFILSTTLILFGCLDGDGGEDEPIKVSTIDWAILLGDEHEDEMETVTNIYFNDKLLDDSNQYRQVIKILSENESAISETKKDGYVTVHLIFTDQGYFSERGGPATYDGKESTFYVDKDILKDYVK